MAVEVKRDGAVAVVTISRPDVLNALNKATNEELLAGGPRAHRTTTRCARSC